MSGSSARHTHAEEQSPLQVPKTWGLPGQRNKQSRKSSFHDATCDCIDLHGSPFELEAELAEEIIRPSEVFDNDSYAVHPREHHISNLQGVAESNNGRLRCPSTRRPPGPIRRCPHQKHESWTASNRHLVFKRSLRTARLPSALICQWVVGKSAGPDSTSSRSGTDA